MVSTYVVAAVLLSASLLGLAEGQRKQTRPLPTVTETRERANFDCPEEFGYYPHPTDCTQYYVCVFGGALLESCTGGLMYSQELQTCDWPRNVGCDGLEITPQSPAACTNCGSQSLRSRERERPREREDTRGESRSKYSLPAPPPPAQPKAVVTSRGQPRQLQSQQEIIKQQLYADVEESLPPAEEVESDRQQRVYRGQPSTVGQVQRDRDGYRHSNALPTYKDRGEKIGVISFGTQSQLQHYSTAPDLDEILTNDLTAKKRRKRDAQRSRAPYSESTSWNGVHENRYIHHNRPFLEQPRQTPAVLGYDNEEFQPFVPSYALASNQVPIQYPPPQNFQHFNPNIHFRPVAAGSQHNNVYAKFGNSPPVLYKHRGSPIRHTVEYNYNNLPPNVLETAYSNIVSQAVAIEPKRIRINNSTRTHTDAVTKGFVEQDKVVQRGYKELDKTIKNGYTGQETAETKKVITPPKENHEDKRTKNYEQKRPVSYYTKERPKTYREEPPKNLVQAKLKNHKEEGPKIYKEDSPKKHEEDKLTNHKQERPINFESERPKNHKKEKPSYNNKETEQDYEDQKPKQSAAHVEKSEESPERDSDSKDDEDEPKESSEDLRNDETDDDKPKNSTTSYEYHSDEIEEDDDSGPPPEYYNDKNKYENIYNPFEDPNFDFDAFLARLGSTTSTSTTTTTTTTTTTPRPKPKKIQQARAETKIVTTNQLESYQPLPGGLIPTNNYQPATPAPSTRLKPVKEDLGEDYLDGTNRKQLYSSRIKTGMNKTLPKSDEYEYYYEEYDYPEPSSTNTELSKIPNLNKTEVKYSSKYQDKPLVTLVSEAASKNLPTYNISPHIEQYLKDPAAVPVLNDRKNTSTLKPIPTPFASSTEHFNTDFGPGQFLIETSVITTTTPSSSKKNVTSERKRTTIRTTSKPQKQRPTSTELNVPDSRQEQSNIITSEDKNTASHAPTVSTATATARTLYNSSQYNNINQNDNRYDPFYPLYDDDVALYKDVDYTAQNNYNTNTQGTRASTASVYRGSPAVVREESSKRGNTVYNNVNQDIYQQPSTVSDYSDNSYQVDDNAYRQSSRAPSRGDRNEINELEEIPTTKRTTSTSTIRKLTTTTTPRITTTTQARTLPPKKITTTPSSQAPVTATENQTQALSNNTNPGHIVGAPKSPYIPTESTTQNLLRPIVVDTTADFTLHETYAVVKKPTPFLPAQHLTTVKPAFHYITKAPKSTHQISFSTINKENGINRTALSNNGEIDAHQSSVRLKIIVPTTYSPPKYLLRSILPKNSVFSSPEFSFRPKNQSRLLNNNLNNQQSYQYKTLKAVRKLINPITVNHELSTSAGTIYESAEDIGDNYDFDKSEESNFSKEIKLLDVKISPNYTKAPGTTTTTTTTTSPQSINFPTSTEYVTISSRLTSPSTKLSKSRTENLKNRLYALLSKEKLGNYVEDDVSNATTSEKRFKISVEVPPARQILDEDLEKSEPDQPPSYRPKPFIFPTVDAKADFPVNTSSPPRVSRVNAAIKSLIANAGAKGPTKCSDKGPKCKVEAKQRTSSRGRGSSHYTNSASITSNEVTANRGTPPARSRPTLKPSTSIVSKATEFVDIYKNPPRRPSPLYPQPQPDKTAAKCRKDVCLLPDCSCGGKEIPGDLPVEHVPQIVLLTFDDSVNDLNKGLYQDLFEKGRTNPNGCPIAATFYVSHEWTDYSQVQNLYSDGHELASHTVSHSFGEQFSQKKWTREVAGQREILSAYGGVKLENVRGMRAPFLSVGGNKMFKMLYDSNFTYDSSMPIYENKPPSWPYTLDYKLFHDCMIPPCPTRSYPGVWEVPMVMWQDLNGGRCSMGDACSNPPDAEGVFKMLLKNFDRHYTTNRAPFGLFYHAAWFTQPHHKEGFINFIDTILAMKDVYFLTNWQAIQWVRDPTPTSRLNNFQPFQCDYSDRPKRCNNPKVCNLWHKSGVRYMRTCQPCPDIYPWTGNTGIRSSRIDNDIED